MTPTPGLYAKLVAASETMKAAQSANDWKTERFEPSVASNLMYTGGLSGRKEATPPKSN